MPWLLYMHIFFSDFLRFDMSLLLLTVLFSLHLLLWVRDFSFRPDICVMRKPVLGVSDQIRQNRSVQPLTMMVRGLKICI